MTQRQTNWKNKTKDSFNNKDSKRKFEKPRSDDYSQFKGRSKMLYTEESQDKNDYSTQKPY